jgi:Ca2+-binding RTX toxin-like protein
MSYTTTTNPLTRKQLFAGVVVSVLALLASAGPASAAVTAIFNPASGALSVFGDTRSNEIVVSRDGFGFIRVQAEGPIAVKGGVPATFNTKTISVFGQFGDDAIRFDEGSGPLPAGMLFGGSGRDDLTGGAGSDQLFGQEGADRLAGRGGADQLFGGSGNDRLNGGPGDDTLDGGSGFDLIFGGAGRDTVVPGEGLR